MSVDFLHIIKQVFSFVFIYNKRSSNNVQEFAGKSRLCICYLDKKKMKRIIYSFLIGLLFVPFLYENCEFIEFKPLAGVYSTTAQPDFKIKEWFEGNYQANYEKYIEHNVGLRNFFVRVKNQFDYSLFNISNAAKVIVGKDGYLFEQNYIDAYLGTDFAGEAAISDKVRKIKNVQSALKKKNIDLIVALAPGKASFYPEYIPSQYNLQKKKSMNYDWILKRSYDAGINVIDLAGYLLSMKQNEQYPLMPKTGIHWSYYGMTFCADTLIKYMENLRQIKMPRLEWSELEVSEIPRDPDNDLGDLMNLLWDISFPPLAYPKIYFTTEGKVKPKVLVVGDSYYWNLQNAGIIENVFANQDFWYYNYEIYSNRQKQQQTVNDIDFRAEVEKNDFIILLTTDAGTANVGYGFIDKAYEIYASKNDSPKDTVAINRNIQRIKSDPAWMEAIRKKAGEKNISIEDMIIIDAEWLTEEDAKKK